MASVQFSIRGKPMAKARPRACRIGKGVRVYDPQQKEKIEAAVIIQEHALEKPFEGAVAVNIDAYFAIPKSVSKKKREAMIEDEIMPTKKPDIDNIFKFYSDAMSGIIFDDDKQIVEAYVVKMYSETPSVWIEVRELEDFEEKEQKDVHEN